MVGGRNSNSVELMSVERFKPETNSWEMVKEMKKKRWGPGVAVFHKQIVVMGGRGKRAGCAEVYNEEHDTWAAMTSKIPMDNRRYSACTAKKPWDWDWKNYPD